MKTFEQILKNLGVVGYEDHPIIVRPAGLTLQGGNKIRSHFSKIKNPPIIRRSLTFFIIINYDQNKKTPLYKISHTMYMITVLISV